MFLLLRVNKLLEAEISGRRSQNNKDMISKVMVTIFSLLAELE
jgi:hypothetical protein